MKNLNQTLSLNYRELKRNLNNGLNPKDLMKSNQRLMEFKNQRQIGAYNNVDLLRKMVESNQKHENDEYQMQ